MGYQADLVGPMSGQGVDIDANFRSAHALEYIAAQLWQIRTKLVGLPDGQEPRDVSDLELGRRVALAPVTILIDERPDGVHLSYDTMASS